MFVNTTGTDGRCLCCCRPAAVGCSYRQPLATMHWWRTILWEGTSKTLAEKHPVTCYTGHFRGGEFCRWWQELASPGIFNEAALQYRTIQRRRYERYEIIWKNNYELRQHTTYPQLEPLGVKHGSLPGRVTIVCQVHARSIFASLIGTPKDEHAIITHVKMRSHNLSSPLALFVQCIWSSIAAPLRNFENTSETTVPFREYHDMKLCRSIFDSNDLKCTVLQHDRFWGAKTGPKTSERIYIYIYIYR